MRTSTKLSCTRSLWESSWFFRVSMWQRRPPRFTSWLVCNQIPAFSTSHFWSWTEATWFQSLLLTQTLCRNFFMRKILTCSQKTTLYFTKWRPPRERAMITIIQMQSTTRWNLIRLKESNLWSTTSSNSRIASFQVIFSLITYQSWSKRE